MNKKESGDELMHPPILFIIIIPLTISYQT